MEVYVEYWRLEKLNIIASSKQASKSPASDATERKATVKVFVSPANRQVIAILS